MNLSDFIDRLLKLENIVSKRKHVKVNLPVYVVNGRSGTSYLVNALNIQVNDGRVQGLDEGEQYITVHIR